MGVKIAPDARRQFVNASGVPYSGAKLFYYAAGSTTKQNTYTTSTGGVANSNPIILDSAGRTPYGVWFTEGLTYKEVLAPSTDTDPPGSPIFTEDNLSGINDANTTTTQWLATALTPTYVSPTQFTVAGDQTTELHVGRRLQFSVTAGTVYGRISVAAYAALTTITVVMDSGQALDSGLSSFNKSINSAVNPAIPKLTGAIWDDLGVVNDDSTQSVAGVKTFTDGAIIKGTATNDSASAGYVGEVLSSTVLVGAAVSLVSATPKNVTSLALTAGHWDVVGRVVFNPAATTNVTVISGSISEVTNTHGNGFAHITAGFVPNGSMAQTCTPQTIKLSAPATVYLVVTSNFTVSTMTAHGEITATRRR